MTEEHGWNDTKANPPWAIDADDSDGFRRLIDDLFAYYREKPAGCDFPYEAAEVFEAVKIDPSGGRDDWPAPQRCPTDCRRLTLSKWRSFLRR